MPVRAAIDESITSVFDALDGERLTQLVSPLVRAGTTWILSGESSLAGARTLHSGLAMVRPGVRLLEPAIGAALRILGTVGRAACEVSSNVPGVLFHHHETAVATIKRALAERSR